MLHVGRLDLCVIGGVERYLNNTMTYLIIDPPHLDSFFRNCDNIDNLDDR